MVNTMQLEEIEIGSVIFLKPELWDEFEYLAGKPLTVVGVHFGECNYPIEVRALGADPIQGTTMMGLDELEFMGPW